MQIAGFVIFRIQFIGPCWPARNLDEFLVEVFFGPDGDDLAGAVRLHTYAVNCLGGLHRSAIVGDNNELSFQAQFAHDIAEAIDIGFI